MTTHPIIDRGRVTYLACPAACERIAPIAHEDDATVCSICGRELFEQTIPYAGLFELAWGSRYGGIVLATGVVLVLGLLSVVAQ